MLFSDGQNRAAVFRAGLGGGKKLLKPVCATNFICSISGFRWAQVGPILLWTGKSSQA